MNKQEWLKSRNLGLGGSDAGIILGKSSFMTNVDLWKIKTGKMVAKDISNNERVLYGTKAERPLIELFALDFPEYEVIYKDHDNGEYDITIHPETSFLRASLDMELIEKSTGRKGVGEIKTAMIDRSTDWVKWDNQIPESYFCQCIHNTHVACADFFVLKAQLKSVDKYGQVMTTCKHYKVERSEVQPSIDFLIGKEVEFWEKYVLTDTCPPLLLPSL